MQFHPTIDRIIWKVIAFITIAQAAVVAGFALAILGAPL